MKKIISAIIIAALSCLAISSCNKYEMGGADTKTLTISFDRDGNTIAAFPAEGGFRTYSVVVNQGSVNRDIDWTVTVDNDPDWVIVDNTTVETDFVGTYGGDDKTVTHKGISLIVDANATGAKRTAVLRFTVADGSSITATINQNK